MSMVSNTHGVGSANIAVPLDSDLALRLLQLQERLNAWDVLYNEEIGQLRTELAQVRAEFVRRCQADPARAPRQASAPRRANAPPAKG